MMKKILLYSLCLLMLVFMFAGCKNTEVDTEPPAAETVVQEDVDMAEESNEDAEETVSEEMIANGDFAAQYESWGIYTEGTICELGASDGNALIPIQNVGRVEWAIQLYQDGIALSKDCEYKIKFDMKSSVPRTAKIRIQKNGSPYTGYLEKVMEVSEEAQSYEYVFTMEYDSDRTCRLVFNLGNFEGEDISEHDVIIDNVSLELVSGTPESFDMEEEKINNIRVNQLGYKPDDKKLVVFSDVVSIHTEFRVVSEDGEVVYVGEIGRAKQNVSSGEVNRVGDFSDLKEEGSYYIEVNNYEPSPVFVISENVYNDVTDAVLKMFYYQRCSMDLTQEYAGDFAHDACHLDKAKIHDEDEYIDTTGGWHDAGDFGKYVTPGAKSVIDLLIAYEDFSDKFSDNTNIPEAGNGIPDILDEAKRELDFLLKMQDATTGGVYHKVTTEAFESVLMPEDSHKQLILSPISGVATADFAAVMAKASKVYEPYDSEFAVTCLERAELAWAWLEANPNEHVFVNLPNITTGEYGDDDSRDERFWAAAELYNASGKNEYHDYLKNSEIYIGMGWQEVGLYGVISYLKLPEEMQDESLYMQMKETLIAEADKIMENSSKDAYQVSLAKKDYVWGSNMLVANNAIVLLIASEYNDNDEYVDTAFEQLNYLLGKNALGISYITGFGTNQVYHPHHRITQTVGEVFEGLVIGGPNANLEDPYAQTVLAGRAPAKCYADSDQSYSTNEITIYWNSPVVYLLNYFN